MGGEIRHMKIWRWDEVIKLAVARKGCEGCWGKRAKVNECAVLWRTKFSIDMSKVLWGRPQLFKCLQRSWVKGISQMKVWAEVRELFAELCPMLCCPWARKALVWLWRQQVESPLEELWGSQYTCGAISFGIAHWTGLILFLKGCWGIEGALRWDRKPVNTPRWRDGGDRWQRTGSGWWKEIKLWDLWVHLSFLSSSHRSEGMHSEIKMPGTEVHNVGLWISKSWDFIRTKNLENS